MALHHMAVDAALGVVAQVAGALPVAKGEETQPCEYPDADSQKSQEPPSDAPAALRQIRRRVLWGVGGRDQFAHFAATGENLAA